MYAIRSYYVYSKWTGKLGGCLGSRYGSDIQKEAKVKNLQVHGKDEQTANISNRTAINLSGIKANDIEKGFLISKKGFLRGFDNIDISFKTLPNKELKHNQTYSIFIGSKRRNNFV